MACFTTASCVHFLLVASLYIAAADVTCTGNSQPGCAGNVRSDQLLQRNIHEDKVDIHEDMKEKEEQEPEGEEVDDKEADGMEYCVLRRKGNPHSPDFDGVTCPIGMDPIKDESDCQRAAHVLGEGNFNIMKTSKNVEILNPKKSKIGRIDVPYGCYLDKKQRKTMKVKWNPETKGELNPEMINKHRSMCRGRPHVSGNKPEDCGARAITSAEDCKSVADDQGYTWNGTRVAKSKQDGCILMLVKHSVNDKGDPNGNLPKHKYVWWNENPDLEANKADLDVWRPLQTLCKPLPIDPDEDLYCEMTAKQECANCDGEREW